MAGNKKEVDLVIRAKEQAAGAVNAVADAIDKLIGTQAGLQQAGAKTDSTLGKLQETFTELKKSLGGGTGFGVVEREVSKAKESVTRLQRATADAAAEYIGYEREARQAARATAELRAESERVSAAVKEQASAVEASRQAQARLESVTKGAVADRAKLVDAEKKLGNEIEEQRLRLALATAEFNKLQAEINQTAEPTKALSDRFSNVGRVVRETTAKLADLRTTQAVVRESIDATARSVQLANDKYAGTAAGLKAQEAALTALESAQRDLNSQITVSANAQAKLEAGARKAASGLEQQEQVLVQSEQALREVSAEADRMNKSLSDLEKRARGPLLSAFGQQVSTVAKLKAEYAGFRESATRLGAEIAKTKNPTEAQVRAFGQAADASVRAKAAWIEQQAALQQLRAILRESGGDVDTLAARQERFAAALARATGSYKTYEQEVAKAASASQRAAAAAGQAAGGSDRLASGFRRAGKSARVAAGETNSFAGAIRNFYGESRQALSFTQRLRSEVLSLVAAYGGFYAIIDVVRNTVDAYRTLEAAQSRLNVVFDGNKPQVANELDFIRRNAERLGIEFGVLAQEYSKFAVSTKGTNLEGDKTRKIFIAVAEAARVQKLSLEDTKGVFVALSQIAGKGRLSMEELRQQIGDRFPGAVQIMAEAAGVTVAELFKLVETGQISSDILDKFADKLTDRFGSALPAALQTTTTAIGKFQNAAYQAFLRLANGGFIERFTALVNDLTDTLQSSQFESFLDRISVTLGKAADALAFLARNFDLVVISITAFLGLKIAPFIVVLVSRLGLLTGATVSTTRGFRAMYVAVSSGAVSMSRTAIAVRSLTLALRGLLSSTGIGLAVVAIGAAIGAWVTSTEAATDALNAHQETVDSLKNSYDKVGGSVEAWRKTIDAITITQARKELSDLEAAFAETASKFNSARRLDGATFWTTFFGTNLAAGASKEFEAAVDAVIAKVNRGEIAFTDLRKELDKVSEQYRDGSAANKRFAEALDAAAKDVEDQASAIQRARDVITVLTGSADDAAAAWKRLTGATEDTKGIDDTTSKLEEWNNALRELKKLVPEAKDQMEILDEKAKLKNALDAALKLAQTYGQVVEALKLYEQGLDAINGKQALQMFDNAPSGALGNAAELLRQFEGRGGQPVLTPYWDVNAFRIGYGSDTVTLSDGTIKKVVQGMQISVEDANRDLVRRVTEFQNVVKGQIGNERFGNFSPEQQAVLTSIAYNYGELPARILDAVRNGTSAEIAAAIRGLKGDNAGVNSSRREKEAQIFIGAGEVGLQGSVDAENERVKALEKANEERKKQQELTAETIAQGQFDLAQQELINQGKEREAAIEAAIRDARKQNPNITQAEIDKIREQTAALYDQQHVGEARKKQLEEAEKAEKRVNDLIAARTALQEQLEAAISSGAGANVTAPLRDGIQQINDQLQDAITKALELYKALGLSEPAIQAAVAKLQTLKITSTQAATKIIIDWRAVEQQFASGLTNAFDRFSQAVAEGVPITEAARDAFLQFASDFLKYIAQMILQQVALNIARGITGALGVGVAHTGGVVGSRTAQRRIDPGFFAGAMRYHGGGIAGLRPGEVPTILQRGEEVLTQDDPRHIFNGGGAGGGGSSTQKTKIVNAIDSASFLDAALQSDIGERILLNYIRANADAVRSALA